jgi:chemotaxis protein methyltransferase CheR
MAISAEDFNFVSQFAREHAALVFEPGKEYLVETRLSTLAQQEGFPSLGAYIGRLRTEREETSIHQRAINALTTNETFFFRDFHPFEALKRNIIPDILKNRASTKRLNIWSGACSTGQEPYSIAMLLRESFPELKDWSITIIATDLASTVLKMAQEGRYTQFEVNRGLPANYLIKYFAQEEGKWRIKEDIRKMVSFRQMNLNRPWPMMAPFDCVFLRNVMIYFDIPTKKEILRKIRACLLPHGHLFLGSAETTTNLDPAYKPVSYGKSVAYQVARAEGAA